MPAITYTLPAIRGTFQSGGTSLVDFGASTVSLTFDPSITVLRYDEDGGSEVGDPVTFMPMPTRVELGGTDSETLVSQGYEVSYYIDRLNFSGGQTVVLNVLVEPTNPVEGALGFDYLVELGGAPLPEFANQFEFERFLFLAALGAQDILEGEPFGPGQDILLADLPDVEIIGGEPEPTGPTEGPDLLEGDDGPNDIDGLGGNDTILGAGGDDTLTGGAGNDRLEGGPGSDVYIVDRGDTVVEAAGDPGFDEVRTATGLTIAAGVEQLTATGNGNIRLNGSAGDEVLVGNAGDNILVGFGGEDTMTGDAGADSFVLTAQAGTDPNVTITDWGNGDDRLAIDDQLLGLGARGIDLRELTASVFRDLRDSGAVGYNGRTGELRIDIDGDGDRELVATLEGGARLGLDDVLLF
ncbi:calcium-binding protein [Jannaschia formosa]|uniref:calcium-binding protein n=1 Tax=Jannaschia formosa TaxID=2259592 RepID=UPI001074CD1B|nr:calcium-binding protein [Jannaschia formosa]TFL19262.1 hypothetical protein DR046_04875 [Jannaschia formosa]